MNSFSLSLSPGVKIRGHQPQGLGLGRGHHEGLRHGMEAGTDEEARVLPASTGRTC